MKILITGAAGFIGSHLAQALEDHMVIGVDNLNDYYPVEIKQKNIEQIKNIIFFKTDITDKKKMKQIFEEEKPEIVFHLAARAGVRASIINPSLYVDVNVAGTTVLLELCKQHNARMILASSSSVYGERNGKFCESDRVDFPISPYAATKKACEEMCYAYHHLYGMNCICLRFFTVYGERGRPDMAVYKFTKAILSGEPIVMYGDGTSKRDYTYIADIVNGIKAAMEIDGYEIINLGNDNPVELKQLIKLISDKCGREPEIRCKPMQEGDVKETWADITKAKRLLNYSPQVSIEEGIKRFVGWYILDSK